MGHIKDKYTAAYFLKRDGKGKPTPYGVEGLKEFKEGTIRKQDKDILSCINFKGATVIDFGFGRGETIKYASDHRALKIIGVDFSRAAFRIASKFLNSFGINADLYCKDALDFLRAKKTRLTNNSIDVVLMLDFIEHVPRHELTQLLKIIRQALSERSVIAINTPIFAVDNDVIFEGLKPRARDTSDEFVETQGMHCNRYTKNSLKRYMRKNGFIALSGHLFVKKIPKTRSLDGSRWSYWKAFFMGYRIKLLGLIKPEKHEYAFSKESPRNKKRLLKYYSISITNVLTNLLNKFYCSSFVSKTRKRKKSFSHWVKVARGPLKGHFLFLNPSSSVHWHKDMIKGKYDSFIYRSLKKHIDLESKTVWDVGAHIGYHSLALATMVGSSGKVIAIEPNPHNINRIRRHLRKNQTLADRVTMITCALSSRDTNSVFVFSDDVDGGRSSGSHLIEAIVPETPKSYRNFSRMRIKTFKADTLLRKKHIPPPDIVKVDVEGAEHLVIEGAKRIISKYSPLLYLEVHKSQAMLHLQKTLKDLEYSVEVIYQETFPVPRWYIMARPSKE